uniref:Uncharacterized protein n=1 Tax=viral metagenome TaxID=1070528 RepID=A0A6C0H6F3_9ZZZZ
MDTTNEYDILCLKNYFNNNKTLYIEKHINKNLYFIRIEKKGIFKKYYLYKIYADKYSMSDYKYIKIFSKIFYDLDELAHFSKNFEKKYVITRFNMGYYSCFSSYETLKYEIELKSDIDELKHIQNML